MSLRVRLQRLEKAVPTGGIGEEVSAEEIVRAGRWLEERLRKLEERAGEAK